MHRLLHDAVRGRHCGRNGRAGRQNIQKFLALEGGGLCIIVQILLRRVAAVDAEQILTAPEKADVRNCAAQHVLDRRFQRRAELLRRAEQRVKRESPDDGIERPVHIARLQNTGQKLRFRHPVQRQQNAVFRVARVLRAAQIAAIEQIWHIPGQQLRRHARHGIRAAFRAVGVVEDFDPDRCAGEIIVLDHTAEHALFRVKIDRAKHQRPFRCLHIGFGFRLTAGCLRSGQLLRLRLLPAGGQQQTEQQHENQTAFHDAFLLIFLPVYHGFSLKSLNFS